MKKQNLGNKRFICLYWTFRDEGVYREVFDLSLKRGVNDKGPLGGWLSDGIGLDWIVNSDAGDLSKQGMISNDPELVEVLNADKTCPKRKRERIFVCPRDQKALTYAVKNSRTIALQKNAAEELVKFHDGRLEQMIEVAYEEPGLRSTQGICEYVDMMMAEYIYHSLWPEDWAENEGKAEVFLILPPHQTFRWRQHKALERRVEQWKDEFPFIFGDINFAGETKTLTSVIRPWDGEDGYQEVERNVDLLVNHYRWHENHREERRKTKRDRISERKRVEANKSRSEAQKENHKWGFHPGLRVEDQKLGPKYAAKKNELYRERLRNVVHEIQDEFNGISWDAIAAELGSRGFRNRYGKEITTGSLRVAASRGHFKR